MMKKSESPSYPDNLIVGAQARFLLRKRDRAALATQFKNRNDRETQEQIEQEWPYASLVLTALDHDASPILLLSRLAEHTRNLETDPRLSLLFDDTAGLHDPLTGARLSVQGIARRLKRGQDDEERLRTRFLRRHPSAILYADFSDFDLFSIKIQRAHLVAGFGEIHWIDASSLLISPAPELIAHEANILSHMNQMHAQALTVYAQKMLNFLPKAPDDSLWHVTGIDPEGLDLRQGGNISRLSFANLAHDAETVQVEWAHLMQQTEIGFPVYRETESRK